ncbi:probable tyrosyl-DNA phosphodiesterase [Anopheles gambiae]|uniref:probable tyrosyl-DNA phosphodiesterase n=1 Tax=Anopheles gambiae TaxID=7165 RepID=UPI002AC8AA6E|nr:probable tyrosyl-DNA phosphodiesterase [Anopheles gambiae]XP_061515591.1 probable tyrosyl-DNA phosphodiesterase [Anopheles gambiae]
MQAPQDTTTPDVLPTCPTEDESVNSEIVENPPPLFVAPRGRMADKLAASAPYNFFLSAVTDSQPTHTDPLSVTFQELLDPSLGELECSLQLTYMIDINWLLEQYSDAGYEQHPLLILYGDESELETISDKQPNVTAIKIKTKTGFGLHHTKMGLYGYCDGSMRVVVSTANLYEIDWYNRTQGLWISPRLPAVPEGSDPTYGESRTDFRSSLLEYLGAYKLAKLESWMARIAETDFSGIKVFLVCSHPCGDYYIPDGPLWGHPRLGALLSQYATTIDATFPLVAQSSGIGEFGKSSQLWIQRQIMPSFGKDNEQKTIRRLPGFRLIYPSLANVLQSHDDICGGSCLPYSEEVHKQQKWLENYMYQWISRTRHRNKAMPHIKTYCRWTPEGLQWFLLTSANFSKSAWGITRYDKLLYINNYEAGVLFLPKIMLNEDFLPMEPNGKHPQFPMPYDVPIMPYAPKDTPFFINYLRSEESESE